MHCIIYGTVGEEQSIDGPFTSLQEAREKLPLLVYREIGSIFSGYKETAHEVLFKQLDVSPEKEALIVEECMPKDIFTDERENYHTVFEKTCDSFSFGIEIVEGEKVGWRAKCVQQKNINEQRHNHLLSQ